MTKSDRHAAPLIPRRRGRQGHGKPGMAQGEERIAPGLQPSASPAPFRSRQLARLPAVTADAPATDVLNIAQTT
jgi:hypothetical protein